MRPGRLVRQPAGPPHVGRRPAQRSGCRINETDQELAMSRRRQLARHSGGPDRGAAAVELALVLPLLLLVLFGIIDFGRMLHAQIKLTEAAREGARASALGQSNSSVQARVTESTSGLTGVTSTVTPCTTTTGDAQVITSYSYEFVTPLGAIVAMFGGALDETFTLTGKGIMPCAG